MGLFDLFSNKKSASSGVAKSPLLIRYPMEEGDHKRASFQNVAVTLSADKDLKDKQQEKVFQWGTNLGLLHEEIETVWHQADKYDFIVQDKAGWNQLSVRNMILFSAVDGKILPVVEQKIYNFGAKIGIKADMIRQAILIRISPESRDARITETNLNEYERLFAVLTGKLSSKEIASALKEAHKTHDFDKTYHPDPTSNLALYRLFWLALYHDNWLNSSYLPLLTGLAMSVAAGSASIQEIFNELRSAEASYGRVEVPLSDMLLDNIRADLKGFYKVEMGEL